MPTKKITVKSLDKTWASLKQGILYTELLNIGGEKVKIYLERDCYNSQSKARVSIWDKTGKQWNQIHWIPSSEQAICANDSSDRAIVFYQTKPGQLRYSAQAQFLLDKGTLVNYAKKVLF